MMRRHCNEGREEVTQHDGENKEEKKTKKDQSEGGGRGGKVRDGERWWQKETERERGDVRCFHGVSKTLGLLLPLCPSVCRQGENTLQRFSINCVLSFISCLKSKTANKIWCSWSKRQSLWKLLSCFGRASMYQSGSNHEGLRMKPVRNLKV